MKKILLLLVVFLSGCTTAPADKSPQYIFYFIGDGMGFVHLRMARDKLSFADFPVQGEVVTYSLSDSITDSAASGTALSTGSKTSNGTVAMDSTHTINHNSLMVDAIQNGYRTAVITSVSLDHATPSAFYAHTTSRNMYREIAGFVADSGVDFFAGAGFRDVSDLQLQDFQRAGYGVVRGSDDKLQDYEKIVWIQTQDKNQYQLPYAVERDSGDMNLPDMVSAVIDFFGDSPFVMMAEGGLIDWAGHDNDPVRTTSEVDDLSVAVGRALEFYELYPDITLIVVTADHETGGLGIDNQGVVSWTTTSHTADNVPLFAIGVGAEKFRGVMQNSDVALKIKEIINQ